MPSGRGRVVPPEPIGDRPYRILFVCTGNICRSPMAEVITRSLAASTELADGTALGDHLDVRSAGTGPWHEGEPMHALASATLARAGYPRHKHVAHQFASSELGQIDLMVALDRRHQQTLRGLGADPTGWSCSERSMPPRVRRPMCPTPTTATMPSSTSVATMIAAACTGLVASLAAHWDTLWAALAATSPPAPVARRCWSGSRPRPARVVGCDIVPAWSHAGSCAAAVSSPPAAWSSFSS